MFEVVGAWHKGGLVGAKKSKAEPPGLSFCRQNTGGPLSILGKQELGGAREAKLREGGVVL